MSIQVDVNKLTNFSKKNSSENSKNTVFKALNKNDDLEEKDVNDNEILDESKIKLISEINKFSTNAHLYLKCKTITPQKKFISKKTEKDCVLQPYIFIDKRRDEIKAISFNNVVDITSSLIKEEKTYQVINQRIQLAEKAFNPTKCNYKQVINDLSKIIPIQDNGKFKGVNFSIIPFDKIADYPIGKLIDVFGFILEDNCYKSITSKNQKLLKLYKITIGDDTLFKIDVTLWEPFANDERKYSVGDLIVIKN